MSFLQQLLKTILSSFPSTNEIDLAIFEREKKKPNFTRDCIRNPIKIKIVEESRDGIGVAPIKSSSQKCIDASSIRPSNGKMMGEVIGPLRVPFMRDNLGGCTVVTQPTDRRQELIGAATADGSPLSIDPAIDIVIVY